MVRLTSWMKIKGFSGYGKKKGTSEGKVMIEGEHENMTGGAKVYYQ